ncbi:hypothetical protein [Paraburkholderia solisilvae]|uniref:Uncharacterized protein n=1 Tax=Paraburkholderia solisilvae TaxID=624376 RepID=A0A6J5DEE8_9BURK|nr:hypothetical protein [Paraburkholderia solisilvae]CAB3751631.1 hypothetical protein LMG29739_01341 [Paraburkholderia solisilvae]
MPEPATLTASVQASSTAADYYSSPPLLIPIPWDNRFLPDRDWYFRRDCALHRASARSTQYPSISAQSGPVSEAEDGTRAIALARATIEYLVAQHDLACLMGPGGTEGATNAISRRMMEIVDWYCGNEPRRIHIPFHWPWPPGWGGDDVIKLRPEELLLMAVQFRHAAAMLADSTLREPLVASATRLVETATKEQVREMT